MRKVTVAMVNVSGVVTKVHMLRMYVNGLSCLGDVPTLDGVPFTGIAYVVLPNGLVVGTVVFESGRMASDVMGCLGSPPWAPCVDRDECVRTGDGQLTWQGRPFTGTVCTLDIDWRCVVEEAYADGSFVMNDRASWYTDGSPHSVHRDGVETTWFSDGNPKSMSLDDSGVVFNIVTQHDGAHAAVVLNDARRGAEVASSLSRRTFDRTVSFIGKGIDVPFVQLVSRCPGLGRAASIELHDTAAGEQPLFMEVAFPRSSVSVFSRPKAAAWE